MTRTLLCLAVLTVLGAVSQPAAAAEKGVERVEVVNLPKVQNVTGRVEVLGPVRQTELFELAQKVVSPVGPDETTNMVLAGTLQATGFGSAVLSLAGQVRAASYQPGQIGAILIPDVEPARTAFLEEGQLLFPLRVEAEAAPDLGVYFSSDQPAYRLGFDVYNVFFYNTTDRPVTLTLFAYLGN